MRERNELVVAAMLFENEPDEERLKIEASLLGDGSLLIHQESEGDLTRWCFEESPHTVDTLVSAPEVRGLGEYFHVETSEQVLEVLVMEFTGYDAGVRIRELLKRLELPYEVREQTIVR